MCGMLKREHKGNEENERNNASNLCKSEIFYIYLQENLKRC